MRALCPGMPALSNKMGPRYPLPAPFPYLPATLTGKMGA